MKKILYFTLVIIFNLIVLKGQIIEFADPNFKAHLVNENVVPTGGQTDYPSIPLDFNNNGEIEISEAESIEALIIENNSAIQQILELGYFTNLKYLSISDTQITELNIPTMSLLEEIKLNLNQNLESLHFSSANNLLTLYSQNQGITDITLPTDAHNLSLLIIDENIATIDLSALTNLRVCNLQNNALTSLDISSNLNLEELYAFQNEIETISFPEGANSQLENVMMWDNNLSSLNISSLQHLKYINVGDSQLNELTISECDSLELLSFNNNNISDFNFNELPRLRTLNISGNPFVEVDVSETQVMYIHGNNCTNLEYVNLKNGVAYTPYGGEIQFANCPNLAYVCEDDFDVPYYFDYSAPNNYIYFSNPDVVINSYCSFEPGGRNTELTGLVKYSNTSEDCSTDFTTIANIPIDISDSNGNSGSVYTNSQGEYVFYSSINNGTITYQVDLGENPLFTVSPNPATATLSAENEEVLQDFCLSPIGTINDLSIVIIPVGLARPGFESQYKIIVQNEGNQTLSGTANLQYQDDFMDFVSASPAIDASETGILQWSFTDLQPFQSLPFEITMQLNTPTDAEFPLNGGSTLTFNALVLPIENDFTPENNSIEWIQNVVNGFDPNDKMLLEGENITPEMVGEYVHYRIRFENTGNASAVNIVVKDELDSQKLDIESFRLVDASHEVEVRRMGNKVEFIFENIELPFEESQNEGYVVFKIKTLENLELNNTFSNQAEIYFDYNAPIITNDFSTTVSENLEVEDISDSSQKITLLPNPAHEFFKVKVGETIIKVEVFDVQGRVVKTYSGEHDIYTIGTLTTGVYSVKVRTENQTYYSQLIVK